MDDLKLDKLDGILESGCGSEEPSRCFIRWYYQGLIKGRTGKAEEVGKWKEAGKRN
jgi:hypothetical protein